MTKMLMGFVSLLTMCGCHHFHLAADPFDRRSEAVRPAALSQTTVAPQHVLTFTRLIAAPKPVVWEALADYGNVHVLSPSIRDSRHTAGPERGVGAVRECKVAMGMTVTEDVESWEEEQSMVINMHSSMPVRNHQAEFQLVELDSEQTSVTFEMRYDTKAGLIGTAMNATMIEKLMRKSMVELLDGLEHKAMHDFAKYVRQR